MASSGGGLCLIEEINTNMNLNMIQNNVFKDNIADLGPSLRYFGEKYDMV